MKKVFIIAGKITFSIAALICFLTVTSVNAQSSRQPANVYRRIDEINRQTEKIERDKLNRELRGGNKSPVDAKQTQAIRAQIKEDLEGFQFAYNQMVVNLQAKDELDPNFIREVNAKVKKYAERLVQNLSFPKPEKDEINETPENDPNTLRELLSSLTKNIYSFLTNPIFEAPIGLEIEQAKKARYVLDKILLLSKKIKENSESLGTK